MTTSPTWWAPALSQAARDRRLSGDTKAAIVLLWQDGELSTVEWRPYKAERLALQIGVERESAARILRRLVEFGYLLVVQPDPRAPRQFLLVNHVPVARAA
mgnify:CR=1 FL=1